MSLSYYDERRKPTYRLARLLIIANGFLAIGMTFYWSGFSSWIAEPFKWAMRDGVTPAPNLFEYPYLTLWLTPTLCMCGGWLAIKAERSTFARVVGAYPSVMLAMIMGWYYLTPVHWH